MFKKILFLNFCLVLITFLLKFGAVDVQAQSIGGCTDPGFTADCGLTGGKCSDGTPIHNCCASSNVCSTGPCETSGCSTGGFADCTLEPNPKNYCVDNNPNSPASCNFCDSSTGNCVTTCHLGCLNGTCTTVSGGGSNQCSSNSDCACVPNGSCSAAPP